MRKLSEYIKEGILDDDFDVDFSHEKIIEALMKWKVDQHIDVSKKDYDKVKWLISKDLPKVNSIDEVKGINKDTEFGLLYLSYDRNDELYSLYFFYENQLYGGSSRPPTGNWRKGFPQYFQPGFYKSEIREGAMWIVRHPELFLTTMQKHIL